MACGDRESRMDSLVVVCLKQVSKSVADNRIHCSCLQELPTHLLEDLVPMLSAGGLSKLHWIFQRKGIDVQRYWLELHHQVFQRDTAARRCSCHDSKIPNEDWRQRFLDKICQQRLQELKHCNHDEVGQQDIQSQKVLKILENPLSHHCDVDYKQGPLDDYYPSSLGLESRLLPSIQINEKALHLLQRNLTELVLSHYLPKYNTILKKILERLIHCGVLRKFTLKYPKCLTPAELFSILKVCAGKCGHDRKENGDSSETNKSCKKKNDGIRSKIKHSDSSRRQIEESTKLKRKSCDVDGEKGESSEAREPCKRKSTAETLPERQCCDCLREPDEKPLDEQPEREDADKIDRQDLYDFCFSEPINAKTDLHNVAVNSHLLTPSDTCPGSPFPCPVCDAGTDGDADTPLLGTPLTSQYTKDTSQSPQDGPLDATDACICSPYHYRCDKPTDHCIQHLVLCGFMLNQPDYSKMLQRVLSIWPGIQELEFIDNLMLKDSCGKTWLALVKGQQHTKSLRRLRIEDNCVDDLNLLVLKRLLLRTKLEMLELKATELEFLFDVQTMNELGDAFSQLSVVKLSHNKMSSISCLERALSLPDCRIRHLDLEGCKLDTRMLDRLFSSAKDCRSLRELDVGFNHYSPMTCAYSRNGYQTRLPGLIKLIQSSRLTKLDLSGCRFKVQGWTHAKDFVEALRQNCYLRQLLLLSNVLTNDCLRLLADAFVSPSTETDFIAPRLCLDISYNKRVTHEGLQTFSQVLQEANTAPDRKVNPPRHLTITMEENRHRAEEYVKLAKIMRLTVNQKAVNSHRDGSTITYGDLMFEHLSQM